MGISDNAHTVSSVKVVLDLEHAVSLSRYRVRVTRRLGDRMAGRLFNWIRPSLLSEIRDLVGHLSLVFSVPYSLMTVDCLVVRGFRTKMLFLVAPILWLFRARVLFLIHHNVQYAHTSRGERLFVLLCRMNFRFGLLEGADGLVELGVLPREDRFVTLPIPVAALSSKAEQDAGRRQKIGVIGRSLKEKNSDHLLRTLLNLRQSGSLPYQVLFSSNSETERATWAAQGFETRDSTSYADYTAAIASVDVLLLNYDSAFYYYRSSGVITDGASQSSAVVAPDFPVFRRQILEPCAIGAVFSDETDLSAAIERAFALVREQPRNFSAWATARSPEVFAEKLDAFLDLSLTSGRR